MNLPRMGEVYEKYGLQREVVGFDRRSDEPENTWFASVQDQHKPVVGYSGMYEEKSRAFGSTPLEAAMRALVKSVKQE